MQSPHTKEEPCLLQLEKAHAKQQKSSIKIKLLKYKLKINKSSYQSYPCLLRQNNKFKCQQGYQGINSCVTMKSCKGIK